MVTLVEPIVAVAISLAVYFAVPAAAEILLQAHLQRAIAGHARATVTSFAGMGRQLTGIALYFTIGGLAEQTTWHAAVGATALITLLIAAPLVATRHRVVGTTSD